MPMLSFQRDGFSFNVRTAGVLIHEGHVLMHHHSGKPCWVFPGGRAEEMEPTAQAIVREFAEETGLAVRVNRLLYVVESFEYARRNEQIAFYYLLDLEEGQKVDFADFENPDGPGMTYHWATMKEALQRPMEPACMQKILADLPHEILHAVEEE